LAWVIISVANSVTRHYSEHKGFARALLAFAEFVSFLASKGKKGKLKLPGVNRV
jgi:hypothetical protein